MDFHKPVLLSEAIDELDVLPNKIYIDGTLGHGGHTLEILKKGGLVYGIDYDQENLKIATDRIESLGLSDRFFPINASFIEIPKLVGSDIPKNFSGLILDLGLSSSQQTSANRGFSFNDPLSIDMRLNPDKQELTAEEVINTYSFPQLYEIFSKLAQEKLSKPLILKIIRARQRKPLKSGLELAKVIRDYYEEKHIRSKIDPATKIFLALRIFINHEFENLSDILEQSITFAPSNSKIVLITFHSGEDRSVKQFIRKNTMKGLISSSNKTTSPSATEIAQNPLSRSAILRSYKIN